jgi:hypothetical protein
MADKPKTDDDANSRFVWQPGDVVILSPAPTAEPDAKAVLAELSKLAQPDTKEQGV